jgi:hypothetical protein
VPPAGAGRAGSRTRRETKRAIACANADAPFAPGVAKIIDELIAVVAVTATTVAAS